MNSHYAVFFCLFSALLWLGDSKTHRGVVGGHIEVGCSFTLASTNKKFFCKSERSVFFLPKCNVLIETNNNEVKGRYKIEDKKDGVFYVTITGLKKSDTGTYWCGVERAVKNTHQKVIIVVEEALCDGVSGMVTLWDEVDKTHRGVVGGDIRVECSFTLARNNKKFFCKGKEKGECIVLIETTNKNEVKGRYTIGYKRLNVLSTEFYVTITGLEKSDTGTYWCGVERSALNLVSETHQEVIIVVEEVQTTNVSSVEVTSSGQVMTDGWSTEPVSGTFFPISTSYPPYSGTIVFVGAIMVLVVMVTLLGMATLIFCAPPEHSNIPVDTDCAVVNEAAYEEIREENRQSNLTPVNVCTVYSSVSSTSPTTNIHLVND